MNKHIRYLELARNVAELSDYKQFHIGSLLVYKKQIVSMGCNANKTHRIQAQYNRYRNLFGHNVIHKLHSEIACLIRAERLEVPFEECILYIFRQHKNGILAMARPCPACLEMIKSKGIKTICYSTENSYAIEYIK